MGCRATRPQGELVRVTRRADGTLAVGRSEPGRGAYLCAGSTECLDSAERRRSLAKALRGPVAPEAGASLRVYQERSATMGSRQM